MEGGEELVGMKLGLNFTGIDITDSGDGIPEEDIDHIFRRFYGVSKARAQTEKKSGLGLPITRAIVDSHGGKIFASNVDQGARFRIILGTSFKALSGR